MVVAILERHRVGWYRPHLRHITSPGPRPSSYRFRLDIHSSLRLRCHLRDRTDGTPTADGVVRGRYQLRGRGRAIIVPVSAVRIALFVCCHAHFVATRCYLTLCLWESTGAVTSSVPMRVGAASRVRLMRRTRRNEPPCRYGSQSSG